MGGGLGAGWFDSLQAKFEACGRQATKQGLETGDGLKSTLAEVCTSLHQSTYASIKADIEAKLKGTVVQPVSDVLEAYKALERSKIFHDIKGNDAAPGKPKAKTRAKAREKAKVKERARARPPMRRRDWRR